MVYSGIVTYDGADIAFQFDEQKLSVFPSYELFRKITMHQEGNVWYRSEKKPFTDGFLEGKVNGQPIILHFFFDPMGYGTTQKNIFECEISIFVNNYIQYNTYFTFPAKDVSLIYKSQNLHRFLGLIPNYEVSSDMSQGLCADVKCDTTTTQYVSHGVIDGVDISIKPSYSCSWGGTNFKFFPEILIKMSEIRDENHLLKLYNAIRKFIMFAFMRIDISPDSFIIENVDHYKGEIYSNNYQKNTIDTEDCNSIWRDSIPWGILYKHAVEIIEKIYMEDWYMDNMPKTKDERLWVSDIMVSKEAAAFEHEFSKTYPDGLPIHSEKRLIAEKEVESEIQPLFKASHGKKRDIYKGFISHIRNDGLGDKIEFCLNEYEDCIKWLKSKIAPEFSNEEIADTCANIRNNIDHGNKVIDLDNNVAKAYSVLRALNYAMQLKRVGYETNDIDNAIMNLYYISGIAP
jgi:hypothetical protein